MNRMTAILLVLLGGASYGLISPLIKLAYEAGFSAGDVTSSQYFFAMLMLVILALFQVRRAKRMTRNELLLLIGLGVLSTGTSVFYYLALSDLPASLGIVLLFQFTWVVMLIDFLVTRNRPTTMKWAALALVLLGTIFAVDLFHTEWRDVSATGLALGLLSSVTYSGFLYLTGYVKKESSPIVNSAVISVASMVSVFFVFPPYFLWNGSLGQGLWVWALAIGFLGQVLPPICFNVGIPIVGGSLAGVLGAIELPVAVVAAWIILHEQVVGVQWIGILLILLGIVASELRLRLAKKEPRLG